MGFATPKNDQSTRRQFLSWKNILPLGGGGFFQAADPHKRARHSIFCQQLVRLGMFK
jgi:hypothetical protein